MKRKLIIGGLVLVAGFVAGVVVDAKVGLFHKVFGPGEAK